MKNQIDYSIYRCPFDHMEKECGHQINGPDGFCDDDRESKAFRVWCPCGFRGPAFYLDPEELGLKEKEIVEEKDEIISADFEESDINLSFFINCYDRDGEIFDDGIFVCVNDSTIIKVGDINDLESMLKQLQKIKKEITDTYNIL